MAYTDKTDGRNYDKIQHEELRRKVDPQFNEIHDVLSDAYYSRESFIWGGKNYGILDKDTFDKLHALIYEERMVKFHAENLALPKSKRIDEDEYRYLRDKDGVVLSDNVSEATITIEEKKGEGFEIKPRIVVVG